MQQIILRQHGDPSVLTLTNAPTPVPSDIQVFLRVKAIGINFSDVLRRRDAYFLPTSVPFVLGAEVEGRRPRGAVCAAHEASRGRGPAAQ